MSIGLLPYWETGALFLENTTFLLLHLDSHFSVSGTISSISFHIGAPRPIFDFRGIGVFS